jgi:uncharacterized membrane protein YoaK (UPF0700 family)
MVVKGNDIRGSEEARAVNKGLKQKELDDSLLWIGLALSVFVGYMVGSWIGSFTVGFIAFMVFFAALGYWYYKE